MNPVQELQQAISRHLEKLVLAQQSLQSGLSCWGRNLLSEEEMRELGDRISETKTFLESLQVYNSPGKLKSFRYNDQEVKGYRDGLDALQEVESLQSLVADLASTASFLSTAEAVLPAEHEWVDKMKTLRDGVLAQLVDPAKRVATTFRQQTRRKLSELKKTYVRIYLELHTRTRLGINEDKRKIRLMEDERFKVLQRLATIDLMPSQQLTGFQNRLTGLQSCFALTEQGDDRFTHLPALQLQTRCGITCRPWRNDPGRFGRRFGQTAGQLVPDAAQQPGGLHQQGNPEPAPTRSQGTGERLHRKAGSSGRTRPKLHPRHQ